MRKFWFVFLCIMIACLLIACNLSAQQVISEPTSTPNPVLPVTPLPTPTPYPTLLPTPDPAARVELGDRAFFDGDWETALQEYQNALDNHPDPVVQSAALLGLGRTDYQMGQFSTALDKLRRIPAEFPDSPGKSTG